MKLILIKMRLLLRWLISIVGIAVNNARNEMIKNEENRLAFAIKLIFSALTSASYVCFIIYLLRDVCLCG
jgi:hypothetical protein